jgi:hypothetical protein
MNWTLKKIIHIHILEIPISIRHIIAYIIVHITPMRVSRR